MNLAITEREIKRNLKCEECELIPTFSLYNYKDIKLNIVCNEGHSNTFNLNDYIKKIKNLNNRKELFCSYCNKEDAINFCHFVINIYVKNVI